MRRFLVVLFLAGGLLTGVVCCGEKPRRRHVLLLTADTLRADHLGCYGYSRPVSPRIDELANEAVVFLRSTSPANSTNPSFSSLLTGTYVKTHGVITLSTFGFRLSENLQTLAEVFHDEGYLTIAAVSAHHMAGEQSGFRQGFDYYFDVEDPSISKRRARDTNEMVLALLEERYGGGVQDKPLFLWMHYFDPHTPYEPDSRHLERVMGGASFPDRNSEEGVIARYDAEIRGMDEEIGILLDRFREYGLYEETVVVFTADHGENLGEREGLLANHHRLFEPVVNVPLIVKAPGLDRSRIDSAVQTVDVFPTVARLALGRSDLALGQVEGVDLTPFFGNGSSTAFVPHPYVFSVGGTNKERMIKSATHKLTYETRRDRFELYDLVNDPGETRDLATVDREMVRRLKRALDQFVGPEKVVLSIAPLPSGMSAKRLRITMTTTTDVGVSSGTSKSAPDWARLEGNPPRAVAIDVEIGPDEACELRFSYGGGPLLIAAELDGRPLTEDEILLSGVPFHHTDACLVQFDLADARPAKSWADAGEAPRLVGRLDLPRVNLWLVESGDRRFVRVEVGEAETELPSVDSVLMVEGRIITDRELVSPVVVGGDLSLFPVGQNRLRFRGEGELPMTFDVELSYSCTRLVFQAAAGPIGTEPIRIPRSNLWASFSPGPDPARFFLLPNVFSYVLASRGGLGREGEWGGLRLDVQRSPFTAEWNPIDLEKMDEATRQRLIQLGYLKD